MEERILIEPEFFADTSGVLKDLGCVRVLLGRYVSRLFEQGHIDEGRRVALRAGVAVPVPVAAKVPRLVDDADLFDTRLLEARPGDQPREAAADQGHIDVIRDRLALDYRHVRVVDIVREGGACEPQVLVVAVRAQPLLALFGVPGADRFLVDEVVGSQDGFFTAPEPRSKGSRRFGLGRIEISKAHFTPWAMSGTGQRGDTEAPLRGLGSVGGPTGPNNCVHPYRPQRPD